MLRHAPQNRRTKRQLHLRTTTTIQRTTLHCLRNRQRSMSSVAEQPFGALSTSSSCDLVLNSGSSLLQLSAFVFANCLFSVFVAFIVLFIIISTSGATITIILITISTATNLICTFFAYLYGVMSLYVCVCLLWCTVSSIQP